MSRDKKRTKETHFFFVHTKKEAKNVKQKYNISGDSKDKVAYVDFDIMTVGGKEYVGKEEEW